MWLNTSALVFYFSLNLFLLSACGSSSQSAHGSLTGVIVDPDGQFIADVQVKAGDQSTLSTWKGVYEFERMTPGEIDLQFQADWFEDQTLTVTVEVDQQSIKDVTMQYRTLDVLDADRQLWQSYNSDYDWLTDTVAFRLADQPTRRAIGKAIFLAVDKAQEQ